MVIDDETGPTAVAPVRPPPGLSLLEQYKRRSSQGSQGRAAAGPPRARRPPPDAGEDARLVQVGLPPAPANSALLRRLGAQDLGGAQGAESVSRALSGAAPGEVGGLLGYLCLTTESREEGKRARAAFAEKLREHLMPTAAAAAARAALAHDGRDPLTGDREVQRLQKVETKEQKTARVRVEMNRVKRT